MPDRAPADRRKKASSAHLAAAWALVLLLASLPAFAQSQRQAASNDAICRSQCGADAQMPGATATTIRACMIRCQAGQNFAATTRGPQPGTAAYAGNYAGTTRGMSRPTGLGQPVAPAPTAQRASSRDYASLSARPIPTAPMQATPMPAKPVASTAPVRAVYGAVYATPAPAPRAGMAVGLTDRLSAYREAEGDCRRKAGGNCRLVAEFTDRCAAVAEIFRRSPGALFMTSDPSTQQVLAVAPGSGPTQGDAELAAMDECGRQGREAGSQCRITVSRCAM